MPELKRVCVFCGSRPGARKVYAQRASDLGAELADRGIGLVYGGASVGTMGTLADAVLLQGGTVHGVIPQSLVDREIAHTGVTELRVVRSMHERKALMEQLSDGFIALPGGVGTLEELLEIITWGHLGLHQKPVGVLDVAGYFEPLRRMFETGVHEGFITESRAQMVLFDESPKALLDRMRDWVPPLPEPKWIRRSET